jgi:hypothetical protein
MLIEIGKSVVRQDIDLHFLTFKSFNDISYRTHNKMKNAKFESKLSFGELKKIELETEKIFIHA